jgi:hypothetical protein
MAVVSKTYELKVSTKDAQANVDELNKSFEAQEDLVSGLEKELAGYNKKLSETEGMSGKAMQRRDALNKKIKETKNRLIEEKQGLKDVNKDRKRANDTLKKSKKDAADYTGVLGILDSQTGGLISSTKNFTGSVGGAAKGLKLARLAAVAFVAVPIIAAIAGIASALTSSEEGQNKMSRWFTQIKVVIGNVTDILSDFGFAVIKVFSGDFKGARESINAVTEGIKNFGEETSKEIKKAGELADARAKADKLERQLQIDRAEATRKFNELREIAADKENVSIGDRIAALKEAGRIEEEITLKEIEAAKLRADAKTLENSLSKSTKEDLDEEAALRAKVIELEASRLKKQKTLTAEITTNLREAKAERKAEEAAEKAAQKEADAKEVENAKKLAELKKQIRDAEAVSKEEKRALELIKIEEHFQNLLLQAEEQNLVTDELDAARREALVAKQAEYDAEDDAKEKALADKKTADREKELAEEEKIEAAKRATREKTFNNAVLLAGAESKVGKALLIARQIMLARQLILDAKEQISTAKKALSNATVNAAESGVELGKGAAKSASAAPPPLNIPFILSFAATAFGIVSAIKSAVGATKSAAASAGAGGGGSVNIQAPNVQASAPEIDSIPPEVTGVGGSGISQIASALGNQAPVQAFVVSNDVTTAQGLERNIIDGASL